jgi:molecular chaperone DnaJ
VSVERKITVRIPAGVDTGSQLRLQGEGEPGEHGGPRGDLFVVIHVKQHAFFTREGEHLLCELPISFVQAALGDTIRIPLLGDEEDYELKIPAGTQPGEVLTVSGFGMPVLQRNRRGDLFVRVIVKIPKKLDQRQRGLLEEFAKTTESKGFKNARRLWEKIKKS